MLYILYIHFHSVYKTSVPSKSQYSCPHITSMLNNITEKEGSKYSGEKEGPIPVYVSPKSSTEPDTRQNCISIFEITRVETEFGLAEEETNMNKQIEIIFMY